ncbi:MAG: TlpA disulfide reductase family protein [Phycisphaerales bacterium]
MHLRALVVMVACAGVASAAAAQDAVDVIDRVKPGAAAKADGVDPAAKAVIDESRGILKDLRDLSCTAESTMTVGETVEKGAGEYVLTFDRVPSNGAGMLKKFRIAVGGKGGAVWAFDGETSAKLDHGKKTLASMEAPGGMAFAVGDGATAMPNWAMRDVLMTPTATIVAAKLLPDAKLDGVTCRVVEYTVELPMANPLDEEGEKPEAERPRMILRQVRSLGAADLLVRKIESWTTYSNAEGQEPRSFVGLYTNVKGNTRPDAEVFRLERPAGYAEAEADAGELGIPGARPKLKFAAGDTAPDFALKDPHGKDVTLASLKGRIVLLDFWATWCGPCKMAMPKVQAMHEKFAGKPVSIFGVNTWERGAPDIAQKYMEKHEYTYGLLLKGDSLATAYGISGIPTFVLIGADSKILFIGVGFGPENEEKLEKAIEEALGAA